MNLARTLYERFRQLIHEFAKFGVIGVLGLVITNGVYDVLHNHSGVGPVTSTTIATIVATIVAYIGNRYWSFRHRTRTGILRETVVFFVLNGIGLLIQDAAVAFNYYALDMRHSKTAGFIALNVGIALATLFRFWSYRKFVWLAPSPEASADGQVSSPASPPLAPPGSGAALPPANGHALSTGNGHTLRGGAEPRERAARS